MCLAYTYLVSVGIELGIDGPRGAQEGDRGVGGAAEGEEAGVDGRVHSLELTHNIYFLKNGHYFVLTWTLVVNGLRACGRMTCWRGRGAATGTWWRTW